jgi:hypothetical protein
MDADEQAYADYLTELYGDVFIGNYSYDTGPALYAIDETAFRVGMADWQAEQESEADDE